MKSLYLFFGVYFISVGMTGMAPKFYGEIGLSDAQIGAITTVMTVAGLLLQPVWGTLADRAAHKKTVLAAALAVAGVISFLVLPVSGNYGLLLLTLTVFNIFLLPAMPVGNAIGIEYTSTHGKSFGPSRMMGTIGYQVGILGVGLLLAESLRGLYPAIGVILLLASGLALLLPAVRGHQGKKQNRVPISVLFRNRDIVLLLSVTFLAHIGHQFCLSFFTKHLGDLGMGNSLTGLITMLSVILTVLVTNKMSKVMLLGDMRELGDDSQKEHRNILDVALKFQPAKLLLVGEEFAKAYKSLYDKNADCIKSSRGKTEVMLFENTPALAAYLKDNPLKDKAILIKGSHSIGLEKLFDLL